MKFLLLTMICLSSFNSFAIEFSGKEAVFTKTQSPGFALPEYQNFQKCEIYRYKVVKTMGVGQMQTTEEKRIKLAGPALKLMKDVIDASRSVSRGPTDGQTTSYSFASVEDNTTNILTFSQTGFQVIETEGSASRLLKNFIDKICK
jgi:hypothetical protein